jgi:hypothetical protein
METVEVKFRDRFGVEPPRKATMLGWGKRAFATGNVKEDKGGTEDEDEEKTDDISNYGTDKISRIKLHFNKK